MPTKRVKTVKCWAVRTFTGNFVDIHFEKKIAASVMEHGDELVKGYFVPLTKPKGRKR